MQPCLVVAIKYDMQPLIELRRVPMSQSSKIAERLRAHARLCRQIAGQSWDETTAEKLKTMAEECEVAAAKTGPEIGEQDQNLSQIH
jgi:hypothetical protein